MKGCSLGAVRNIFDKWHHIIGRAAVRSSDYSGSTIPTNSTNGLIEEEKEEDEINATTPTNIEKEQFANISK